MQSAAPLLCAGITLYSPLVFYGAKANADNFKVGIVGIGGLGAMGLKISKAMGNKVFGISSSARKKEYIEKELGATFLSSSDAVQLKEHEKTFDLVISTVSADTDVHPLLKLLKSNGGGRGRRMGGKLRRTSSPVSAGVRDAVSTEVH